MTLSRPTRAVLALCASAVLFVAGALVIADKLAARREGDAMRAWEKRWYSAELGEQENGQRVTEASAEAE